jgi:ATP-dependent Clp protease protease subunit
MTKLLQLLADNRQRTIRAKSAPIIVKNQAQAADGSSEATLYLYDSIVSDRLTAEYWGGVCAQDLVPQIAAIEADTIHVRINSPGGDVFAAQAISTALSQHKAQVIAHIDGIAASAATSIACSCDQVEIASGAMYMIHNAWTFAMGNRLDLLATAALLEKVDGQLAGQYQKFTNGDLKQITDWMDAETWFTADEAVANGFASRLASTKAEASAWNLSAYARAPKAIHAPAPPVPEPQPANHATEEHRARQQQRLQTALRTRSL